MELNAKGKRRTTVNPEGSIVLDRKSEIQYYLEAANLRINYNSFYKEAPEKLKDFIALGKKVDKEYAIGLAKFLADKGIKLSPVIILSILSDGGYSFRWENKGVEHQYKKVDYIFNTPQRVAEAVALKNLGLLKLNNSFKEHILKIALENMGDITIRKNKMKRRKIKEADLIKLLHPKPKDTRISKLFKAVIENTKEASLKETENIVSIKSSTKLNEEEKKELIDTNLEKMPINQIIRNIKFLADKYDFKKNIEIQQRIIEKLNSVKDYKLLNIFDVITAAMYVPQFERALFEVVKRFVERTREEFAFPDEATLLFDVSGSMQSFGMDKKDGKGLGFQYLILFALLMKKLKLRTFSNELNDDKKELEKIIKKIQEGSFQDAFALFDKHFNKYSGGTALVDSAIKLCDKEEIKNLIILSDEVSWKEGKNLTGSISELSKKLSGKNIFIINPVVYEGTCFDKNVVAISSLNPSVLTNMAIFLDEAGFIKYIKNYKR